MKLLICLFALLASTSSLAQQQLAASRPSIVLGSAIDPHTMMQGRWLNLIYAEAFRRLGYTFHYRAFPSRHSAMIVEANDIDGELNRHGSYGDAFPNMVKVQESHFSAALAAFAVSDLSLKHGWQSLAGSSWRVECRIGIHLCEKELPPRVARERLSSVGSAQLGLRKLMAKRTDIYIDLELVVQEDLRAPEFRNAGVRHVAIMEDIPVYAYLHKRHAALARQLGRTLAAMKKEGLIEAYRQQAIRDEHPAAPSK